MSGSAGFAPLSGVRILDFCTNLAGPFGAMILAQLGADVVKVEAPGGDDSRSWGSQVGGVSAAFSYANVGKRSVVLDLKAPRGREVAQRLLGFSDVVLQSMRPGVADRIGIGEAAAREANPDVLYYDVNAFGAGPVGAGLPGYDPLVQAFSGIMAMTGHDGAPPTRCAPSIIDLGTGMWVAMGVLAALFQRRSGGTVARVETALVDTAFSLVGYQATHAFATGIRPPRAGSGNPIAAPYQCYEAADGFVLIAAANERLWRGVVQALGAPELAEDPRFLTLRDRSLHRAELEEAMNWVMRSRSVDEWIGRLAAEGVPAGRVQGLEEAAAGEVAVERGTFIEAGEVPLVRLPWLVDGDPVSWQRQAPAYGQHTGEVLEQLGYSPGEIEELVAGGSVSLGSEKSGMPTA